MSLRRELGVKSLVAYYFSTVVGAGIFIVPLQAAKIAGPASILAWLIVFLLAFPFAMIFASISQKYKVSGSIQKFLEDVWGAKFGQSIALFLVISAICGNALLGYSAAGYLISILGIDMNVFALGVLLMVLPCLFNLMNIGLSSKIQFLSLAILIILVEVVVFSSVPHIDFTNIEPFAPNGLSAVLPALVMCFYSVTGWENVDAMAEEVKNPSRTYKIAALLAIGLICLFYLSLVVVITLVLPYEAISETSTILTALLSYSLGNEASIFGGAIAIILLLLGANAWIFGTSRLIFALSRDKVLPSMLSKISKNDIPSNAVLIQVVTYLLISLGLIVTEQSDQVVVELCSLNYLLLYAIIFFTAFKGFKGRGLKLLSGAAMLITCFLLINADHNEVGFCVSILLACFVYRYSYHIASSRIKQVL